MAAPPFEEALARRAAAVEEALARLLPADDRFPETIHRAMRYSALGGGKRLRGALALAAASAAGGDEERALPVAAALEMIHAYSLVHDDLPCMDDDDMRRGKPTCHRVFGEAVAVLAGDALLTRAFEVLADLPRLSGIESARALRIVAEVAAAAGTDGLIGGQVVDLESEGRDVGEETLQYIHSRKTGALFRVSLVAGALAGGGRDDALEALVEYGRAFGLAFQITDDLLDVVGEAAALGKAVGRDADRCKATYVRLFGLEGARAKAEEAGAAARRALAALPPTPARAFLDHLVSFVLTRRA